ncbi:flavoprotein [Desulfosporosinus sp. OT]|uniref:flavoprotein n=1 Tax=Desulfosporosinus sp. OT TaxID=913865 RepID=UPI0002239B39|nr:flavoprotein [Desulfosporosinus sp. OT]EGW39504.1 hypothetical protein DOT_2557 [Desulfosporosinus sp. OT]
MNEELINQIVRRILSEPAFQSLMQGTDEETMAVKPEGLVLLNFVPDFERVLKTVKKRFGAECTLNILPSESVFKFNPELPEGMNWITPQDAYAKDNWQRIIIPACSLNTLAKAALGLRDNPISEMIGRGLTQGKSIELVTEYLGLTLQTPPAYFELYEGYIQKVQSYGVMVYSTLGDECTMIKDQGQDRASLVEQRLVTGKGKVVSVEEPGVSKRDQSCQTGHYDSGSMPLEQEVPSREPIRYAKKYLADKDAYGFPEESIVLVKRLTVISPLARDTLKMRRIELRQEMEGGRQ